MYYNPILFQSVNKICFKLEISSPNQNRNMPQRFKQSSPLEGDNTRNTVPSLTLLTEENTRL